jgi:ABC-type dipeptide/oligopeptide/nickel transport system ATPase subunit
MLSEVHFLAVDRFFDHNMPKCKSGWQLPDGQYYHIWQQSIASLHPYASIGETIRRNINLKNINQNLQREYLPSSGFT